MKPEKSNKKHWLGDTSKDRKNNVIVITLGLLLITVIVLFVLQRFDHRQILNELNNEKQTIQFELNQIVSNHDSLRTENDTLNEELFIAQTKVKDLLLEVEQTKKVSVRRITRYQSEITSLRSIMKNYIVQVDSLNRRNVELMAENQEVKEQYKQVESENVKLSKEADRLQKNLTLAAMLEASGLIAEPINKRSKPTRYAKRTEKIRISFSLTKNVTTKRGSKNIYVRIRRPDHLLLVKSPDNLFRFEDLRIQYSAVREVNYEGNELPVSIYWDNSNEPELMIGEYTVDVFIDGNNIGTTSFEIK